jgi:hypothetical protein
MELFIYNSFSTTTTTTTTTTMMSSSATLDVIIRIINDYEKYKQHGTFTTGWEYVEELYFKALSTSQKWTEDDLFHYFESSVWPKLINHKVYSSNIYILDNTKLSLNIEEYFYEWMAIAKLDECFLKNLQRWDKYCVLKIRTHEVESMGLPLYQMQARFIEMHNQGTLSMWGKEYVASHLCHCKNCMVCAIKETRQKNLHRNYCVAFRLVDNRLIHSCTHEPKCRDFGSLAFYNDN